MLLPFENKKRAREVEKVEWKRKERERTRERAKKAHNFRYKPTV